MPSRFILAGAVLFVLAPSISGVLAQLGGELSIVAGGGPDDYTGPPPAPERQGPATAAKLINPVDVVRDELGNVFIAEAGAPKPNGSGTGPGARIRKVDVHGEITTIAGSGGPSIVPCCGGTGSGDNGPAKEAGFTQLGGIALDSSRNLYLADGQAVRVINLGSTDSHPCGLVAPLRPGYITRCAGTGAKGDTGDSGSTGPGPALNATFNFPSAVAVDAHNNVYIADRLNYAVKRVDAVTGWITRYVGQVGRGSKYGRKVTDENARILQPTDVEVDADAKNIYIATNDGDSLPLEEKIPTVLTVGEDQYIRIFAGDPEKHSWSGDDGPAPEAGMALPWSVELDGNGGLLIADAVDHRVRRVDLETRVITTVVGDGSPATSTGLAHLQTPVGLAAYASATGPELLIADVGERVDPDNLIDGRVLRTGLPGPPVPIVNTLSPTVGPVTGNIPFLIEGDLLDDASVTFGPEPAQASASAGEITGIVPRHLPPGPVPVGVSTPKGGAAANIPTFTYHPALTALSRPSGKPEGGDTLTIYGEGFKEINQVRITTVPETVIPISGPLPSDTEVTITTPPHPQGGEVRIFVKAYGLESIAVPAEANIFTYKRQLSSEPGSGQNRGLSVEDSSTTSSFTGPGAISGGGFSIAPLPAGAPGALGSPSSALISSSVPGGGSSQAFDPASAASGSGTTVVSSAAPSGAGSTAQVPQARIQLGVRPVVGEIPEPDPQAAPRHPMVSREAGSAVKPFAWAVGMVLLMGCFAPMQKETGSSKTFQPQRA